MSAAGSLSARRHAERRLGAGCEHDLRRWRAWVTELGGETVRLIWVRSDAATLYCRLSARGSERDSAKLADFGNFTASMRLDAEPAAPHVVIDNRLTSATALEDQVATLTAGIR